MTTDPYAYFQTGSTTATSIGTATYIGSQEQIGPIPVWSADVSALATEYATYGADKIGYVDVYRDLPFTASDTPRFTNPVEGLRTGVTDCTRWRYAPYQQWGQENVANYAVGRWPTGLDVGVARWAAYGAVESEKMDNCAIYRPTAAGTYPVLIFWPGGGGDVGGAICPWYWAHRLASMGIVVVVGNYPRGFLGHFYHADLTGGPNYTLEYQRALVRWVSAYISAFDGDPTKITVSGGSFGGASTLAVLEDASVRALVARMLVISGGGGGDRRRAGISRRRGLTGYERICERAFAAMNQVLPAVGDEAEYLRETVPPEFLVQVHNDQNIFPWEDGSQLAYRSAVDAARDGIYDSLDTAFVVAPNEASVLGITHSTDTFNLNRNTIASLFGYPGGRRQMETNTWISGANTTAQNVHYYSGALYWWPAYQMAVEIADAGGNVSLIYDNYKSAGNGNSFTAHTSFIGYMFGGSALGWKVGMSGSEMAVYAQDVQHSEAVMRGVLNFCTSGDWNGSEDLPLYSFASQPGYTWGEFSLANREWNILGVNSLYAAGATASNTIENNWRSGMFTELSGLPVT